MTAPDSDIFLASTQVRLSDASIAAGDLIGQKDNTGGPSGTYNSIGGTAVAGATVTSTSAPANPFGFFNIGNNTQLPPTITSISPNSGPSAGGTSVTITGTNLTGVIVVRFGSGSLAASFTVNSDTQIVATTAAVSPGTVDVTVSNQSFTSAISANDRFTFTHPVAPTVPASNLAVTGTTPNTVSLSWTNGNGAARIVVAKQAASVDGTPADDTTYFASAGFGFGTQIGTGNFVVFRGTGNTVTVGNLASATQYSFAVFEYNGSAGTEAYNTTSPATVSQQTPIATYTWKGGTGSFAINTNWTPARTTPATSDILQFNDGTTETASGVTTQTLGKLLISNSTQVTLQAAASSQVLTIGGGAGALRLRT